MEHVIDDPDRDQRRLEAIKSELYSHHSCQQRQAELAECYKSGSEMCINQAMAYELCIKDSLGAGKL